MADYFTRRGDVWCARDDGHQVRVLCACVDGYIVARRPRAVPFLLPQKEFAKRYHARNVSPEVATDD